MNPLLNSDITPVENTYIGPFLIVKKLGNRRHKVFHARQTEQERDVVLKFISVPPDVEWSSALDKIDREVSELQKLQHPNLVKVYGAGVDDEKIFFASELIEGESLAAILARRGKLTPDLVVEYGHQISEFLNYLHSVDLVHSKLTPEKIMVTSEHRIKIIDLRLNRAKKRRWDSKRRRELDIAAYMAPEQFTIGATPKSDFYTLGVILYEMLTGKLPYQPDTMGRMTRMKMNSPVPSVATHVMNCPIWLDKIVTQMLSPDPRERPHSARAISFAFEEIKKIASTKKAAVSQITSGFNPLTVGEDKTEAQRLLGIKKKKKKKSDGTPFFQNTKFQFAALMLIACVLVAVPLFLIKSSTAKMADAKALIQSEDAESWREARLILKPIMDGNGKDSQEAKDLYFDARRKSLVLGAEEGQNNRLQSENVQLFGKGVRRQIDGEVRAAIEIFEELVDTVDPDGKERHIFLESQARLESLSQKRELPTELDELSELIAKTKNAKNKEQLLASHELLSQITRRFVGVDGYEEITGVASQQLHSVKEQLANLEPRNDAATEDQDGPSDQNESDLRNDGVTQDSL